MNSESPDWEVFETVKVRADLSVWILRHCIQQQQILIVAHTKFLLTSVRIGHRVPRITQTGELLEWS
jgi:hypothetical protein